MFTTRAPLCLFAMMTLLACAPACAPSGGDDGDGGGGGGICGDDRCSGREDNGNCPQDCSPGCGDGVCEDPETRSNCARDCVSTTGNNNEGPVCGDGTCDPGEGCGTCEQDCACGNGQECDTQEDVCLGECLPECEGRACGTDGCGGSCGECSGELICNTSGSCEEPSEEPAPPQILDLSTNTRTLTPDASITFTALVTDPNGLDDLVGGTLIDPESGATYGAFAANVGTYTLSLNWDEIHVVQPLNFNPGDTRDFLARFFDAAGAEVTQTVTLDLNCNDMSACDGVCVRMGSNAACGACGNVCTGDDACQAGMCEPNTCNNVQLEVQENVTGLTTITPEILGTDDVFFQLLRIDLEVGRSYTIRVEGPRADETALDVINEDLCDVIAQTPTEVSFVADFRNILFQATLFGGQFSRDEHVIIVE